MKARAKKICIVLFLIILLVAMFSQVFAVTAEDITGTFKGSSGTSLQGSKEVKSFIAMLLDAVRIAGVGISLIMLTVIAIKYMAASPNDRADIKKSSVVYVVGAVVMMAASFLVGVVKDFSQKTIKP